MDESKPGVQTTSTPNVYPRLSFHASEEISLNQESDIQKPDVPSDTKEEERQEDGEKEEDEGENKQSEKPLIEEESVKIEIHSDHEGEDTPTLPLPDKKSKSKEDLEEKQKVQLPIYLFPFTRIKEAWTDSSNFLQFLGRAICIIFQTVGWFTCVGGVPFLSLVMLIIGSIYMHDCKIEPNIPIYLVVSGVVGTIQHFLTIWTKYVPKDAEKRLKVYRSYCRVLNGFFHLFLMIWFILGCIWVYGSHSEVEFDPEKDEYCHKTLYYFSFWVLNLSFILLGLVVFFSMCILIFAIATD